MFRRIVAIARDILNCNNPRRPVRQLPRRARSASSSPVRPSPVRVSVAIQTDVSEEVDARVTAGVKRTRDEDEELPVVRNVRQRLTPPTDEPVAQQATSPRASPVATTSATAIDQRPIVQPMTRSAEIAEPKNNGRLESPASPNPEQEQPVKNEPVEEDWPISPPPPPPTQDIIKREVRSSSAPPCSQHSAAIKREPSPRPVKRERDLSEDEDEEGTPPKRFRPLPPPTHERASIAPPKSRVQPKRSPSPPVIPVALQRRPQGEVDTDLPDEQRQSPTAAESAAVARAPERQRYPRRRSIFDDPVRDQVDRYGPNPPRHPDGRIDIKAVIDRQTRALNRTIRVMDRPLRRTERAIIFPRDEPVEGNGA
ncbi:hypothetical protein CYLTODRAFT_420296 [Cylindrobasidium torrendii FP15055 ss-10]|uniref:Uncharacterized protein n=1 Tax=Cylindrobasidium torrendii FP15055 ss-10 TaxID=1314674 RepID=A0A0D7BJR4_9AGAR|nr:hypothetical protein CYLTODRAFT_420296 [Cylindrobasidium torrendii FP15055 ss-10]